MSNKIYLHIVLAASNNIFVEKHRVTTIYQRSFSLAHSRDKTEKKGKKPIKKTGAHV